LLNDTVFVVVMLSAIMILCHGQRVVRS
jgi:hypothetical protein